MPHPTEAVVVRHPEAAGHMVALDPAVDYDPSDPLVKAYPQAFRPRATAAPGEVVESVKIEQASAAPGEKRSRSRKP